ncbi:hypothetical protein GOB46_18340 [Sinorhizobium meliloti]|nr:hypothetical protein [Sinorhizobium meliloti]MDW9482860.1 hypothetical protein [Sinorhizobium meliloti]MDW9514017.1 hypothetical protein [Sinorhizobium meliloti]MDW9668733.1 hypothetical protein [Sinorhizobium meliloti]MDW9811929.1 hypothetical protein [Sinorhizobium meliloti]
MRPVLVIRRYQQYQVEGRCWDSPGARTPRLNSLESITLTILVAGRLGSGNVSEDCNLSCLISVLVTEIQQRRVCGAESVLSAQGLGLAGSL